jgi:hypothetical protein
MLPARRALVAGLVVSALPLLGAWKCFEYEPVVGEPLPDAAPGVDAEAPRDAAIDAPRPEDAGTDASFDAAPDAGPAPCVEPTQARIRIAGMAFQNRCGCAELDGLVCTVPVGTTVVWTFNDSVEHNVTSVGGAFGSSGERLVGTFSFTFDAAGSYPYGCSVHPLCMSGYSIEVVKDE